MRPVTITHLNVPAAINEIERASHECDVTELAQAFTITGTYTTTRTLNVATATLPDLIAFVATWVADRQKGGQNRTT